MYAKDYQDIIGGILLVAAGLFFAIYASSRYAFGTLFEMGPGMFPAALGYLLAGLGVLVIIPALFRAGNRVEVEWRPLFTVLAAVLIFALTVDRFGMIPAVTLMTIASALAEDEFRLVPTIVLTLFLVVFSVLVFHVGLDLPIRIVRWPF